MGVDQIVMRTGMIRVAVAAGGFPSLRNFQGRLDPDEEATQGCETFGSIQERPPVHQRGMD